MFFLKSYYLSSGWESSSSSSSSLLFISVFIYLFHQEPRVKQAEGQGEDQQKINEEHEQN